VVFTKVEGVKAVAVEAMMAIAATVNFILTSGLLWRK
jgi:hypothetical protein